MLAHVLQEFPAILKVFLPFRCFVIGLLVLETTEDGLVFDRNFPEICFSLTAVETPFVNQICESKSEFDYFS